MIYALIIGRCHIHDMSHIVFRDGCNLHSLLHSVTIIDWEGIAYLQMLILGNLLCDDCTVIV